MDLMTSVTTAAVLEKKYRSYAAPTVRVLVDGKDLADKYGAGLSAVSVDLTSEYPASGCSFDVVGEYRPSQTEFNARGAARVLQLGAKVSVELGYIVTECVFYGLIVSVTQEFDSENAPYLHVECMDVKCLLMKMQRLEIRSEKNMRQLVTALLGGAPVSSYLKGKSVLLTAADQPQAIGMESDYDFLVRQAQYYGCEFFIVAGKAYFRTGAGIAPPIMTLSPAAGLYTASVSLQGAPLVKKVTVTGIDPSSGKEVKGSSTVSGTFGKGSAPKRMLDSTERTYFDPRAVSASAARNRAKVLLNAMQQQFGLAQCTCRGLPELVPGRRIRLSGLSGVANGTFYITGVRHTLTDSGFTTAFDARFNSL